MQLIQPNVVGNFLQSYSMAQDRKREQEEAQYNRQRQMRLDDRADQQFSLDMDARQLDIALKRASAMENILAGVDERDPGTLEVAKQRYITTFGGSPQDVAGITMADIPRIKMQTGQLAQELNAQLIRARIGTEQAQGRAADALAAGRRAASRAVSASPVAGGAGAATASMPEDPSAPFPWMQGMTPSQRANIAGRLTSDYTKDSQTTRKQIEDAREALATASRFEKLLETQETGGLYGAPIVGGIVRGLAAPFNPELAEMEAITAKIVPTMRAPGSGSSSDRDMAMFERATMGMDKPTATNKALASGMKVAAQNMIDYGLFKDWWFSQRGSLVGAPGAWQDYLDTNTIFDPNSNEPVLNKSRVPWRAYFGINQSSSRPANDVTTLAPPAQAIEKLRANPALAPAFDQKYGAGAAQRYFAGAR